MTSQTLNAAELIAVLTVYFVVFCPILCWAISGVSPIKQTFNSRDRHSHA